MEIKILFFVLCAAVVCWSIVGTLYAELELDNAKNTFALTVLILLCGPFIWCIAAVGMLCRFFEPLSRWFCKAKRGKSKKVRR